MLGDGWINLGRPWAGADDILSFISLGDGIVLCGSGRPTATGKAHWYRSTDWGSTWTDKGEIPTATDEEDIKNFVDVDGVRVIACLGPGKPDVDRSEDRGDSFIWIKMLGAIQSVAHCGVYCGGDIVLVATGTSWTTSPKVYRSTDKGLTWDGGRFVASLLDHCLSMIYLGSGIVLAGTLNGEIARSTDSGNTWTLAVKTFPAPNRDVVKFLRINGVVYCLLKKGEIWKSEDQGLNWILHKDVGSLASWMTYGAGYWFVSITGGHILRSIDLGQNFTDLGYVPPVPGLAVKRVYFYESPTEYVVLAGTGYLAGDAYIMKASESLAKPPIQMCLI